LTLLLLRLNTNLIPGYRTHLSTKKSPLCAGIFGL
jgi:hypothetical protein